MKENPVTIRSLNSANLKKVARNNIWRRLAMIFRLVRNQRIVTKDALKSVKAIKRDSASLVMIVPTATRTQNTII